MPRYSRRYRRGPRRRTTGGSRSTRRVATRAAKRVFSRMTETKYFDTMSSTAAGVNAFALDDPIFLTGADLGDAENERDGEDITPMSMQIRMTIKQNSGLTGSAPVRVTLVRMRQHSSSTAANLYGSVVYDPGHVAFGNSLLAPYNRNLRSQYEVLYDRRFTLSSDDQGHNVLIRLGRKHLRRITYSTDNGNDGVNQVYMFVRSDQTNPAFAPTFVYWSRMMYKDA